MEYLSTGECVSRGRAGCVTVTRCGCCRDDIVNGERYAIETSEIEI